MNAPMTAEEFEKWKPLTFHIVDRHFYWAYQGSGKNDFRRFRRCLSYYDLISEATVALLKAWTKWDKDRITDGRRATFMTYAYKAIVNALTRYVDSNVSVINTRDWKRILMNGGEDSRSKMSVALSMCLFSEGSRRGGAGGGSHGVGSNGGGDGQDSSMEDQLEDTAAVEPGYHLEEAEWKEACIMKVKKALTKWEWSLLMDRFSGMKFRAVGAKRGVTRERARQLFGEIMVKAFIALQDECFTEEE